MRISMVMSKQATQPPVLTSPPAALNMNIFNRRHKDKVVIILGATGAGKSRLSIDLGTHFPAEIINSDKMQVYKGLNIVTNKITDEEKCGVPHHLLGITDPNADFTAHHFCEMVPAAIESIVRREQLPIIVGGSNSYIEALINHESNKFRSKFEICLLWVDVSIPILESFVSARVDQMVKNGMVEEVRGIFDPKANYSRGIRRAIGVPEFDKYFRNEPYLDEWEKEELLREAINEIKLNTCKLARRQLEKIYRLKKNLYGLKVHRIDATEVFRRRGGRDADEAWRRLVAGPSTAIVAEFIYGVAAEAAGSVADIRGVAMGTALAAATCAY